MSIQAKLELFKSLKRKISNSEENVSQSQQKQRIERQQHCTIARRPDNLPLIDFFIIGAQKAGTMAAVTNLNKHDSIFVLREPHFFDLYWGMGIDWYQSRFNTNKRIIGEKTPELIYVDECAPRMKLVAPNAKFILCLRDPVMRAYSSWNMQINRNQEECPFHECVQRELSSMMGEVRTFGTAEYHYIQRGFYFEQIKRFLKVFPDRSKLLIVIAEHMRAKPEENYKKIFEFLGVENQVLEFEDEHTGHYSKAMKDKTLQQLQKLYEPHNRQLFDFLGYDIPEWGRFHNSKIGTVLNLLETEAELKVLRDVSCVLRDENIDETSVDTENKKNTILVSTKVEDEVNRLENETTNP